MSVTSSFELAGLWGLVNNAGCASYGEVEWVSIGTYRKTLDINLLGTIRLCQAFLPNLRASKGMVTCLKSGSAKGAFLPIIRASKGEPSCQTSEPARILFAAQHPGQQRLAFLPNIRARKDIVSCPTSDSAKIWFPARHQGQQNVTLPARHQS